MEASDQPSYLPRFLRKDNISQEFKNSISSLPVDKDSRGNSRWNYQGFWYYPKPLEGIFNVQKHFRPNDSDIILASFPKSGTTWLKALAFALVQREKCRANPENHPLLSKNPHELVPFLELELYFEGQVPDLSKFSSPRLFSTQMPFVALHETVKNSRCKIVYVCRNIKDTLVSTWHFSSSLHRREADNDSLRAMFDSFSTGVHCYGPFWDHLVGYWKESLENPNRVLFMRYEELKEEPRIQMKRLADFLNCPFSEEEEQSGMVDEILKLCSLDNLSNLEVNKSGKTHNLNIDNKGFFRKGEIGDWKNYLTDDMSKTIDEIINAKLQGSGLEFD